ncbi:hypothetical protein [Allonocardiopsis opalescens]|uniref:Uncharacterized protein n=1 Tax=Allonocardiopsis opalescens TaxID=1144618 RepID=A0A2T0PV76_9ACTN|nr:hypothetical protein [Allonocardiopsis opalescens]PRX95431.1 hypothetical protein CLV72_10938 [Allonocardiopsis opalescens]
MTAPAGPGCLPCARGWEHCHGTLVEHADGTAECTTGPDCPPDAELHGSAGPCAGLLPGCGC